MISRLDAPVDDAAALHRGDDVVERHASAVERPADVLRPRRRAVADRDEDVRVFEARRRASNEDVAAAHMVYWTALYANVERACARQRRRAARLPLLLCRQRYYAEAETDDEGGAGERAPADVVVALARPGLEGAFRHMVTFL